MRVVISLPSAMKSASVRNRRIGLTSTRRWSRKPNTATQPSASAGTKPLPPGPAAVTGARTTDTTARPSVPSTWADDTGADTTAGCSAPPFGPVTVLPVRLPYSPAAAVALASSTNRLTSVSAGAGGAPRESITWPVLVVSSSVSRRSPPIVEFGSLLPRAATSSLAPGNASATTTRSAPSAPTTGVTIVLVTVAGSDCTETGSPRAATRARVPASNTAAPRQFPFCSSLVSSSSGVAAGTAVTARRSAMPWLAEAPMAEPAPRTSCSWDSAMAAGTVPDSRPSSSSAHSAACSSNRTSTVTEGVLTPEGKPLSGNWSVNACPGLGRRGRRGSDSHVARFTLIRGRGTS